MGRRGKGPQVALLPHMLAADQEETIPPKLAAYTAAVADTLIRILPVTMEREVPCELSGPAMHDSSPLHVQPTNKKRINV